MTQIQYQKCVYPQDHAFNSVVNSGNSAQVVLCTNNRICVTACTTQGRSSYTADTKPGNATLHENEKIVKSYL